MTDSNRTDIAEAASSAKGDCRVQFATSREAGSKVLLSPEDSVELAEDPVADELRSQGQSVTVRYPETKSRVIYGLFSKRSGTRDAIEKRKQRLRTETIVDTVLTHCFKSVAQRCNFRR